MRKYTEVPLLSKILAVIHSLKTQSDGKGNKYSLIQLFGSYVVTSATAGQTGSTFHNYTGIYLLT